MTETKTIAELEEVRERRLKETLAVGCQAMAEELRRRGIDFETPLKAELNLHDGNGTKQ